MGVIGAVTHRILREEAAESLAQWIVSFRYPDAQGPDGEVVPGRVGLLPDDFVAIVCRPEPVFRALFERLRQHPDFDPTAIRERKALIRTMGRNDYWQILRSDTLHARCHEHALRVTGSPGASPAFNEAARKVWPHFVRQMDAARDELLSV
jgi:hypothetical protein